MDFSDKIYVAGHNGMVGSALVRKLKSFGFNNIITASSEELDLRNQQKVKLCQTYKNQSSTVPLSRPETYLDDGNLYQIYISA